MSDSDDKIKKATRRFNDESLLPSKNINSILVKQDNHSPCDDIEKEIESGDLYFIGSDTDTNISMYKTHRGIDIADIEDIC